MPFRILVVLMALAAAGCSGQHKFATCHGQVVALNTAYWQPTAADIEALDRLCPSDAGTR